MRPRVRSFGNRPKGSAFGHQTLVPEAEIITREIVLQNGSLWTFFGPAKGTPLGVGIR